jgi:hypothetical protein
VGKGGELEQQRWHAALDHGGDAALGDSGKAVRRRTVAVGWACEARRRSAADMRCRLWTQSGGRSALYGVGARAAMSARRGTWDGRRR